MLKIAVLDDSSEDREWVVAILEGAGHRTVGFDSALPLLKALRSDTFDAIIIDWNLPDLSGVETITRIRTELLLELPIIMVTARDESHETVEGLKSGADDYITKPADRDVLLARLEAVTRRQGSAQVYSIDNRMGEFEIDIPRRIVSRAGVDLQLTEREFKLAVVLFRYVGRAVSRDYLLSSVWGHNVALESRTLDVHISRVRTKLQLSPEFGWRLATVYGYGYRLETMPG